MKTEESKGLKYPAASTMVDEVDNRCVEEVASQHNGNALSASNRPNEYV